MQILLIYKKCGVGFYRAVLIQPPCVPDAQDTAKDTSSKMVTKANTTAGGIIATINVNRWGNTVTGYICFTNGDEEVIDKLLIKKLMRNPENKKHVKILRGILDAL